ncbi:methyltransferase domain-containing protein [Streptomyces sp. NPDC055817]
MHPEARDGLSRMLTNSGLALDAPWRALDLGGRNINGSIRDLLPKAEWSGVDIEGGPGVDVVHDATTPWPDDASRYDLVVSTEVLEHVREWRPLLRTCAQALEPGGAESLFVTCASIGRRPHGASGEIDPPPGEWYANVDPEDLREALECYFVNVHVEYRANPGDAYARAQGVRQ